MQQSGSAPPRPDPDQATYPRRLVVFIAVGVALHLNYWLWDSDRLVLGFPINMLYHILLSLVLFVGMVALVRRHWPDYLHREDQE